MTSQILALGLVTLCGAAISAQGPINATLARTTGGALAAACLSFLVGFVVLALVNLLRGSWPSTGALFAAPAWAWIGGVLGAVYVAGVAWSVPKLGVVTAVAAAVLGQVVAAIALDALGAFGLAIHPISWARVVAVVLVVAGLVLSRVG